MTRAKQTRTVLSHAVRVVSVYCPCGFQAWRRGVAVSQGYDACQIEYWDLDILNPALYNTRYEGIRPATG